MVLDRSGLARGYGTGCRMDVIFTQAQDGYGGSSVVSAEDHVP